MASWLCSREPHGPEAMLPAVNHALKIASSTTRYGSTPRASAPSSPSASSPCFGVHARRGRRRSFPGPLLACSAALCWCACSVPGLASAHYHSRSKAIARPRLFAVVAAVVALRGRRRPSVRPTPLAAGHTPVPCRAHSIAGRTCSGRGARTVAVVSAPRPSPRPALPPCPAPTLRVALHRRRCCRERYGAAARRCAVVARGPTRC